VLARPTVAETVAATAEDGADVLAVVVDGPAAVVVDAIVVAMAVADVVATAVVVAGTRHIVGNYGAARKIAAFFLSRNLIVEAFNQRKEQPCTKSFSSALKILTKFAFSRKASSS
jgi:hypothetical protein